MKIATWNVNSLRVRLPHVLLWLATAQPDVLALQEIKMEGHHFPQEAFAECGYQASWNGQKTYNGVATLSRHSIADVETALPDFQDEQRRLLATTINDVRVVNIYVPNGESLISAKYEYKLNWLRALHVYLQAQLKHFDKVVVLGDFNIAPHDDDVHDPKAWEGHVLVSEAERSAFQDILSLGFADSFRLFSQEPKLYSWWDYRAVAFRRNAGLRIDHVLINHALTTNCQSCIIDKEPRKWEQPSDHTPVVASLVL